MERPARYNALARDKQGKTEVQVLHSPLWPTNKDKRSSLLRTFAKSFIRLGPHRRSSRSSCRGRQRRCSRRWTWSQKSFWFILKCFHQVPVLRSSTLVMIWQFKTTIFQDVIYFTSELCGINYSILHCPFLKPRGSKRLGTGLVKLRVCKTHIIVYSGGALAPSSHHMSLSNSHNGVLRGWQPSHEFVKFI